MYMLPPRGVSTAHRIRTKFGRADNLSNLITHAKCQINWYKIVPLAEVSCFSTTTADAINTAKPCRAACDNLLMENASSLKPMLTQETETSIVENAQIIHERKKCGAFFNHVKVI